MTPGGRGPLRVQGAGEGVLKLGPGTVDGQEGGRPRPQVHRPPISSRSTMATRSVRRLLTLAPLLLLPGCIGHRIIHPVQPTPEELAVFEAAGPADDAMDSPELTAMHIGGAYRLVPGDLLSIQLPREATGVIDEEGEATADVKARVDRAGNVKLPQVGDFSVAGKTQPETEDALAEAYTEYLGERPNVVVTVAEYRTINVAVVGAVASPGIHGLRSDRLSVLGAITAAGGIHADRGASKIRIVRETESGTDVQELEVRMTDIPLADVELAGGETIFVEPQVDRAFAVVGLVKRSGLFPYPQPRRYNLLQVLATAGGVDETAAPRYATIYRKNEAGEVLAATFRLDGLSLTSGSNILIKDGDVIAIEHTEGTWFRMFWASVFGFRASFTATGSTSTTL